MKPHLCPNLFCRSIRPDQRGISLVIVMIFLVILSGLAVTTMQGSTFSSRIAANEADRTLAFQAAEAALRDAENDIFGKTSDGNTPCTAATPCRSPLITGGVGFNTTCPLGLCGRARGTTLTPFWDQASVWTSTTPEAPGVKLAQFWEYSDVWTATSVMSVTYGTYTGATALPVVSRQPRYILEHFPQGDYSVFRITAVGFGANDSTRAILQAAVKTK
jgi:type IV pilus assembly protein PilX